jgi:hypothetical protein
MVTVPNSRALPGYTGYTIEGPAQLSRDRTTEPLTSYSTSMEYVVVVDPDRRQVMTAVTVASAGAFLKVI